GVRAASLAPGPNLRAGRSDRTEAVNHQSTSDYPRTLGIGRETKPKTSKRVPGCKPGQKPCIYPYNSRWERHLAAVSIRVAGERDFRDFSRLPPAKANR